MADYRSCQAVLLVSLTSNDMHERIRMTQKGVSHPSDVQVALDAHLVLRQDVQEEARVAAVG